MVVSNGTLLFSGSIFRCHVSVWGCIIFKFKKHVLYIILINIGWGSHAFTLFRAGSISTTLPFYPFWNGMPHCLAFKMEQPIQKTWWLPVTTIWNVSPSNSSSYRYSEWNNNQETELKPRNRKEKKNLTNLHVNFRGFGWIFGSPIFQTNTKGCKSIFSDVSPVPTRLHPRKRTCPLKKNQAAIFSWDICSFSGVSLPFHLLLRQLCQVWQGQCCGRQKGTCHSCCGNEA